MSKGKLQKFAEMETFPNVFQYPFSVISDVPFDMKGSWGERFFHNANPIVLELGCGKGEYTVGLARMFPDVNFIGVDIKGARMYNGAKAALTEGLTNVAFLRTNIEIIDRFFAPGEVSEIWLTFSDPQMKNARKRLTSTYFMERYRHFLKDGGIIHLKTDSRFLFLYTLYMVEANPLPLLYATNDLYGTLAAESKDSEDAEACNAKTAATTDEPEQPKTQGLEAERPNATILGIHTYYEDQWLSRGLNIKYLKFRLPHDGELQESGVEIELDDYRSYHRQKRSGLTVSK